MLQRYRMCFKCCNDVSRASLAILVAIVFLLPIQPSYAAASLGSYNVKIDETSISGVSSGAMMAEQFGVAWSSVVKGIGVIAGGPYYCGQDTLDPTAYRSCMVGYPSYPTAGPLINITNNWASSGYIDATSNLSRQKIFVFSGYNDGLVKKGVVDVVSTYHANYTNTGNIFYRDNMNAVHTMPTDSFGPSCTTLGGNYIDNCGYDAAGLILQHVYGALNPRNNGTLTGSLYQFNQSDFGSTSSISMSNYGYVYVPASCSAGQPCRVHVALHGCLQNADTIGSAFYQNAGYNKWADTNNLIILYPQTISSSGSPLNPNACWDWWGYTNANYAKKSGPQIASIKGMLNRLAANYNGWTSTPPGSFGAPTNVSGIDGAASKTLLVWSAVNGATGYNVYRATCSTCTYSKVNSALVSGASYSDSGLSANTTYYYHVRAVNSSNVESADSATVSRATTAARPSCDVYNRTVYDQWYEGRAHLNFLDAVDVWANGSGQWIGVTGPLSLTTTANLKKTGSNYYVIGSCS